MPPAIGTRAFSEENALRPHDEECFAGCAAAAPLLRRCCDAAARRVARCRRRCCPTSGTVQHTGCGISSLSQDLFDDGYQHQLAVDGYQRGVRAAPAGRVRRAASGGQRRHGLRCSGCAWTASTASSTRAFVGVDEVGQWQSSSAPRAAAPR